MKNLKITVNGTPYDVQVEELNASSTPSASAPAPAAAPAASVPASAAAPAPSAGGDPVSAPMPGTIVSIEVSAGQSVKSGQVLIILEAMKMENEIVAPRDGVVAGINVSKGEAVDTGATLVTLN